MKELFLLVPAALVQTCKLVLFCATSPIDVSDMRLSDIPLHLDCLLWTVPVH